MRRIALLLPFLTALGGCVTPYANAAPYADKVALCARDTLCSANPRPDGQNGVAWAPQGHNRVWSPGGP